MMVGTTTQPANNTAKATPPRIISIFLLLLVVSKYIAIIKELYFMDITLLLNVC